MNLGEIWRSRLKGICRNPPFPPETVKKFREGEMGKPEHARGRAKFRPPKQASLSPWPTWYLTYETRCGNPLVFIQVFPGCRCRFAEVGEVLLRDPSPAGFWRPEFDPPPGNKRGFLMPPFNFFTASLFQRGKKRKESSIESPKSSPPFEKGRTGGIFGKAFLKR